MRKLFFGGNWKCNNTLSQTQDMITSVLDKLEFDAEKVDVVIAPVSLQLVTVAYAKKNPNIEVSAQNCSAYGFGAYTGEVAASQIKDLSIHWVILGHSERRSHFKETNQIIADKLSNALKANLKVIYCFGETLEQRESKETIPVIEEQLNSIRQIVTDWSNVVLAYEPIWAIGTGKTATSEQVDEVHKWIRSYLDKIGESTQATRVIYGGSVNEKNCDELIKIKDVDGFLVGGASLKPAFIDIVKSHK